MKLLPLIALFVALSSGLCLATAVDNDQVQSFCSSDVQTYDGVDEIATLIYRDENELIFKFTKAGEFRLNENNIRPETTQFMTLFESAEKDGYDPIGSLVSYKGKIWLGMTIVLHFDESLQATQCSTLLLQEVSKL